MQARTAASSAAKIEVDETFIGGKARNMHKDVKARKIQGPAPAARIRPSWLRSWNAAARSAPKVVDKRRKSTIAVDGRETRGSWVGALYRCAEVLRWLGG